MKKKYKVLLAVGLLSLVMPNQSIGSTLTGGDAVDMASADVLLDIAFVIDTSGSMSDEASQISTSMGNIINNLDCPDCNVWVRADFYGIGGTWVRIPLNPDTQSSRNRTVSPRESGHSVQ